jgi:hypothetical protein
MPRRSRRTVAPNNDDQEASGLRALGLRDNPASSPASSLGILAVLR